MAAAPKKRSRPRGLPALTLSLYAILFLPKGSWAQGYLTKFPEALPEGALPPDALSVLASQGGF